MGHHILGLSEIRLKLRYLPVLNLVVSIDLAGFSKSLSTMGYSQLFRGGKRSSAPNASTHTSKVAHSPTHSPCAPVPLLKYSKNYSSMLQKKRIVEEQSAPV
jgi:hypothetical protein